MPLLVGEARRQHSLGNELGYELRDPATHGQAVTLHSSVPVSVCWSTAVGVKSQSLMPVD
jgi:hypothetical protein